MRILTKALWVALFALAACTPAPQSGGGAVTAGEPVAAASAAPANACALFTPAELGALRVDLADSQPGGVPPTDSPGGRLDRTLCSWTGGRDGGNYSIELQGYLWRTERGGEATTSFYRLVVGQRDGMVEVEPGLFVVDNGHAVEFWLIEGVHLVEVGYIADDAGPHKDELLAAARRIRASL